MEKGEEPHIQQHISEILPGLMAEVKKRMKQLSFQHGQYPINQSITEKNVIRKSRTRFAYSVYEHNKIIHITQMNSKTEIIQSQNTPCTEICHAHAHRGSTDKNKHRPSEPQLLSEILPGVMADIRRRRKLRAFFAQK